MATPGPITLLTSGTRGDIQPYVALGLGLQAAGLPVRLAAPEAFRTFVAPSGLPFAGFDGNPSELLARPEAQAALNAAAPASPAVVASGSGATTYSYVVTAVASSTLDESLPTSAVTCTPYFLAC